MIRKQVGMGTNTLFWHDLLVGDCPLKAKCPRLFRLNSSPNGSVSSFKFWEGKKWEWAFSWCREFRPYDTIEWQLLRLLLDRVHFNPEVPDSFIWTPHKSGLFTVKSFSLELARTSSGWHIVPIKGLWKGLVPHRIELFVWFSILEKLNTRAKLAHLGIIPPSEAHCVMCGTFTESSNHLLIHCSFAYHLWSWWLEVWGLQWAFPADLRSAFIQWSPPHKGIFFKKVWLASFSIILWTIWKERNERIFKQSSSSVQQLPNLVLLRLSWWIKGWGDPFPYN